MIPSCNLALCIPHGVPLSRGLVGKNSRLVQRIVDLDQLIAGIVTKRCCAVGGISGRVHAPERVVTESARFPIWFGGGEPTPYIVIFMSCCFPVFVRDAPQITQLVMFESPGLPERIDLLIQTAQKVVAEVG